MDIRLGEDLKCVLPRAESSDESSPTSPIDFATDPEVVRVVAEGERLAYGHLFNPAFATEISMIDPLPHQRIAVYDHMLPQPRLRFLLGDEPGAGKTIMAGLYIREMLARRLLRRILIVPPAGLDRQLGARTADPLRARLPHRRPGPTPASGNPFTGSGSDLVIVSVDTLASERPFARLQEPAVEPYDLCYLRRVPQARRRPPARLHHPQDRPLPGRRGAGGHPGRRPPLVARLGLQPPAAAHRHAPHGQGLPLLRPLAAAGARGPCDGGRLQRLPGRRPPSPFPPPDERGDGQLRGQANLSRAASATR